MTKEEKELLLTVARVLQARLRDDIYAAQEDDLWALHEALKPFSAGVPFSDIINNSNEAAR